jgi:hypothetical protein
VWAISKPARTLSEGALNGVGPRFVLLIIWIAVAFWPTRVARRKGHGIFGPAESPPIPASRHRQIAPAILQGWAEPGAGAVPLTCVFPESTNQSSR